MKKILTIIFLFISTICVAQTYNFRLTNFKNYTKYVMVKYQDSTGVYVGKKLWGRLSLMMLFNKDYTVYCSSDCEQQSG